jgi:hypothetical protein
MGVDGVGCMGGFRGVRQLPRALLRRTT